MMIKYSMLLFLSLLLLYISLIYCNNNDTSINNDDNKNCIKTKIGDHLMIEYQVILKDGSVVMSRQKPDQYYHFIIEESNNDELPIHQALLGQCENDTITLVYNNPNNMNFSPIKSGKGTTNWGNDLGLQMITINIKLHHITSAKDYDIFQPLKNDNITIVMDMIDDHIGINAIDEYGQTPLMIAIINKNMLIISSLLNTRRPIVNVHISKPSGYNAIFYAVQYAGPDVLQSLLYRGADPNTIILTDSGKGNTPLHFACLLEKIKHADLLIRYGASVRILNAYGQEPYSLIPKDAPQSTKLDFKKMFDFAYNVLPEKHEKTIVDIKKGHHFVHPDF